ncbi:MAG: transporter substrate-binding domain-containing protein [Deltaproteobacteria bacterium]|nr:transporter substrate-binding domain-containing protein [Deltaproteobacteria bacterium]
MSRNETLNFHRFPESLKSLTLAVFVVLAYLAGQSTSTAAVPVKVGIYQNAPKVYLDQQGRPAGFFPRILNAIAEKEGWELEYVPCVWNECLDMVEGGELDLMMDVAWSEKRAGRFDFNKEVVLGNWSRIYSRDGMVIHSVLDLDGKRIAVVKGSIQAVRLQDEARAYSILPTFVEVESFAKVFELVEKGEADAGIVNRLFGTQQMENFGLSETGVVLYPSRLMFIAPKKRGGDLLEGIDEHLKKLKKDQGSIYYTALEETMAPVEKPVSPALSLTVEEAAWLAEHPHITIAINQAWPPMDYVDTQGEPQGIGVGFIKALNARLNGRLKITALPWEQMYEGVKEKRIDALMDITPRPDREPFFNFTKPYVTIPHIIIARKDAPFYNTLSDLKSRTVGVERGFFIERVLREKYPGIRVELFNTTSDALDAVSKGTIDAYVGNRAVAMYIAEQELITNLKGHGKVEETISVNAIGVRKDWPILRDILQKALDDLGRDEVGSILRNWVIPQEGARVHLSPEEMSWLKAHPVLRVGHDIDWPPVEYLDDTGRFVGMSVDFVKLLGDIMGVTMEAVEPQSWQTTLEDIEAGSVDILASVTRTPQREGFLLFSRPYLSIPMVIVTGRSTPYIGGMDELARKKVAVVSGYASHDILQSRHPEIDLMPVKDLTSGLNAVVRHDADAFVGSLAAVSHVIGREGLSGLKVSGETPYTYKLSIGSRKDQPILAEIIQKALNAVTEEERNAIYKRWISVTYERRVDYGLLWKILLGAVLVVLVILYWNRRLRSEIGLRRKVEAELVEAKDAAESANRVKSAFLASMSHELRTPLNSIIGFTGIILNELAGPLNLEQKKQLRMIKGSTRHLLDLINDILDISKIEAGELEVSRETFDMRAAVTQVVDSLTPMAEQKGLSLSAEIAPDIGMLTSDERRVRQVLINLVNNAIKFTERGGVRINCRTSDSRVEVEVTDSGIGIKGEDMGRLFKPFQQLDSGLSRRYEGTGLGLSVCKRVLDMLGGTIQVKSIFGEGSTFTFTVPLHPEDEHDEKEDPDH